MRKLSLSLVFVVTAAAALACPFCKEQQTGLFIGETKLVGNGTIRSFIDIAENGKPTSFGVVFNDLALDGLPMPTEAHAMEAETWLALPEKAKKLTAFDHVGFNWNPNGHLPKEIYGAPHFDIHFYTMSLKERGRIKKSEPEGMVLCQKRPGEGFMPSGYVYAPDSEEDYMGAHWIDPKSPEFNGKPFTTTFLYGSYDGKLAFIEPMMTMAYLKRLPNDTFDIPTPRKVEKSGWYPTKYSVRFDSIRRENTVSMHGMIFIEK